MKVYFIGAGPGDPLLITVKGQQLISTSQVVVYAGSLVNKEILQWAPENARIYNSASMTLQDIIKVMVDAVKDGKQVARIHTGDPSLFGAISEQMLELDKHGVEYEVVPGVSSFLAAAASLKQEYTLPDVTQTVILTRLEGRTPVPEREKLGLLAQHQATLCIFLSIGMIKEVQKELLAGYSPDTPVAVVYKASWPEERIIKGQLADLAKLVEESGINKTALILVGNFLGQEFAYSKLYSSDFGHGFRSCE